MEELENTTPPNNNNPNNNNSTISRISTTQQETPSLERRTRPQKDQNINCPRCNSTNTKFCYYNNYSLTQPRFFCKTCRRYWTQGGSLRSVPMGGGSRKNKRSSTSSYSSPSTPPPPRPLPLTLPSSTTTPHLPILTSTQNPNIKFLEGQDLNLAFPMQGLFHHHNMDHQLPKIEGNDTKNQNYGLPFNMNIVNNNNTTTTTTTSALELLRSGIASRGNLNPFVPMPMPGSNNLYQSGSYPNMQEFKPSMNFFSSPNHESNNNNNINNDNVNNDDNNNNGARLLFPFADMNKLATNNHDEIDHEHDHDESKGNSENDHNHSGYWSGMLGGGPW